MMKVNGMDVKTTVTLVDDNGSLKLASRDSDCTVQNIDIHINGGASWLYQGYIFEYHSAYSFSFFKIRVKR